VNRKITVAERRARLARRHRLLPEDRAGDVASVADDLVALHSTDPPSVYMSAWARMREPSVTAVDRALYDDRTVVRHHAMRRTLWVATPTVAREMHAAATRKLVGPERRRTEKMLADNGVADPTTWFDAAREQVLRLLHERGPMTARQVGEELPELKHPLAMAPGKRYAAISGAHTRVLLSLGFEGEVLRSRPVGSWVSGAYAYAPAASWLPGGLGDLDELSAATSLADRWLRRFGPATTTDLQWWMGWTLGLTRRALAACEAVPVEVEEGAGWVAAGDEDPVDEPGEWVAVLPGLDPTTMGWKQRGWYLSEECADAFDSSGNGGPTIWADGRVVGVWARRTDGEVRVHWFHELPPRRRRQVDAEVERLCSLIGGSKLSVRFPSPVHQRLLG
jgi:hypothetical protein